MADTLASLSNGSENEEVADQLREAGALRQTPSDRLQAIEGKHAQRQTQLTPESHHRIAFVTDVI